MPVVPLVASVVRGLPARRPAPPRRARRRLPQTPRARGAARSRPRISPLLAGGSRVLSRAFGPVATLAVAVGGSVLGPLIGDALARRILQRPGFEATPFPKGPAARSRPRPAPQPAPGTSPIEEITVSAPRPRPLAPPRSLPLTLPRVMPVVSPVQRLSPLLDPRVVPSLRARPAPRSSPVSSPPRGLLELPVRRISPRDFLPASPLEYLTSPQRQPVRLPTPQPTPTPMPQPEAAPDRCVQVSKKPRKKGRCEEGFYRERPGGTTFKPWRTRKCR
jgi:hypothetical protein